MQIIPAIDIRAGCCVRLRQGDYEAETVFDEDPVAAARRWIAAGASRLHVVDLDGARDGVPANFDLVVAISRLGPPVQVGGGIRSAETVARYRAAGLDRVVLGTAAVRDRPLIERLCREHGEAIVVSLDAREGRLATDGWTQTSSVQAVELASALVQAGVQRFVYTDISRDGMLSGPNYAAIRRMVGAAAVPIIASGGVAEVGQISELVATGVEAVITGRALYTGQLDLCAAIAAAEGRG